MIASNDRTSGRFIVEANGARIGVREAGVGRALVAVHGFSETGDYWFANGVGDRLAQGHRFIALDMRAHGRTHEPHEPHERPGYDVETLADDIDAAAEALGLSTFVLLGHATGSVVACRYAMRAPQRLCGLILTSAASATAMISNHKSENERFFGRLAAFYDTNDWDGIMRSIKAKPWPFLHQLAKAQDAPDLWRKIEDVFRSNDPRRLAAFVRAFYADPDPRIRDLERVQVPTLVIDAEHDDLMREPSMLIAKHVPGCRHQLLAGFGHMTALECPNHLIAAIERFVPECRRP